MRPKAARGLGSYPKRDRLLSLGGRRHGCPGRAIHTNSLNEGGFVEATIAAFKGRAIHTFHTEGAGGGHAPDIIKVCGEEECASCLDKPDAALTPSIRSMRRSIC